MANADSPSAPVTTSPRPLRIWPALLALALVVAAKAAPALVTNFTPRLFQFVVFAPIVAGIVVLGWWMFASREQSPARWIGPIAIAAICIASIFLADHTMRGAGFMFYVVPTGVLAVGIALVVLSRISSSVRLCLTLLTAVVSFGAWDLIRYEGVRGDFTSTMKWRWEPTAEELLLADLARSKDGKTASASRTDGDSSSKTANSAGTSAVDDSIFAHPEWSEFRGPKRDGAAPGVALQTDWAAHPPRELWHRKVGPGWSSFAVAGKYLYTQEQRGDTEVVVCYDGDTGEQVWIHESPARFWESVAGAGPRATPTLSHGRLYTVGATGLVHCFHPATGEVIWERDLSKDADRTPLMWGFSSSPLVVDDLVIVYAGGADNKGVFAYDAQSGEPRWSVPAGDHSYSSPQVASVGGHEVVLMLTNTGISAIDPAAGKNAWTYDWKFEGYRAIQPLVLNESDILLGTGMGTGTRRVAVSPTKADPEVEDRWTSLEMKPDYNDYVSHKGYLYGFDHNIFACLDLETGKRMWKKGRYGNGQVLLLPDADQMLVLTESGEIVLVATNSEKLDELARHKVLEGKTWNHPVLVGNRLYVRNGEEAACFEMPILEPATPDATEGE